MKHAVAIAVGAIVIGSVLGFEVGWVPVILGAILPSLITGALAGMVAIAITRQLPAGLAFGGLTFAATIILRILFWANAN